MYIMIVLAPPQDPPPLSPIWLWSDAAHLTPRVEGSLPEQELQEVSKFPIEIFCLKSEHFLFLNTLDYGTLINKEIESIKQFRRSFLKFP